MAKTKRRWGDRRDGHWVRDVTGLQCVMTNLMPNRTDCEVCLSDKFRQFFLHQVYTHCITPAAN